MKLRCARCRKAWIDTADGVCSACGFVLGTGEGEFSNPRIAAPLVADDSLDIEMDVEDHHVEAAPPVHQALTLTGVTGAGALGFHGVPERIPGVNVAGLSLAPFEGYLLSLVDGATYVDDLVAASGLSLHEAAMALQALRDRGVIRFRTDPDKNAALRAPDGTLRAAELDVHAGLPPLAVGTLQAPPPMIAEPEPADDDAQAQIEMAKGAVSRGEYPRAREHARFAWMIDPDNVEVAILLKELEDPAYAKVRAKTLHDMAASAQKANNLGRAVELYEAALTEFEPSAAIHHKLALALVLNKGSLEEAERHLERAVELAPTNQTYVDNLRRVRARTRRNTPPFNPLQG
ncbi:MAG: tetratricopeptide repeat protein [Myxococcota bacterium]